MSKKVIDVAQWNVIRDYNKVKASGVQGAIVKVINKSCNPDPRFETHYRGFMSAGIDVIGGYNYSYATSVAKAQSDAKRMLLVSNGRIKTFIIDVEDNCQKGLGINLIHIINAFAKVITDAGYKVYVYTGLSFYNSYIKPYSYMVNLKVWIARYYKSYTKMRVYENPNMKYQPQIQHELIGWQYTSSCIVDGIDGVVDMNIWYDDIDIPKEVEVANPYKEPTRVIKLTKPILQRGNDVKWVQYHLVRLGFLEPVNAKGKSNIDGICGNGTATAIWKAQRYFGIAADKKCGAVTREFLKK